MPAAPESLRGWWRYVPDGKPFEAVIVARGYVDIWWPHDESWAWRFEGELRDSIERGEVVAAAPD